VAGLRQSRTPSSSNRQLLGRSNVTGILSDTDRVAAVLDRHGRGRAGTTRRPRPMSMLMAASAPGTGDHKDACTSRRTSSSAARRRQVCWWSGTTWPATRMPTVSGGGTIAFVDPIGHRCLDDPLVQEGGTPAIVESIRAGPVVALKQAVGTDLIQAREQRSLARVLERWRRTPTWSCWAGAARASP
jgi:hypothetical protein